jgi:hypothetical protein
LWSPWGRELHMCVWTDYQSLVTSGTEIFTFSNKWHWRRKSPYPAPVWVDQDTLCFILWWYQSHAGSMDSLLPLGYEPLAHN